MSYSYYLYLDTTENPSRVLTILSEIMGVDADNGEIRVSGMLIRVVPERESDADVMTKAYGFWPKVKVVFRQSSTEIHNNADRTMFAFVASTLKRFSGNAVLESEDPQTVLLKVNSCITVNQSRSDIETLRQVFPGCRGRVFPDL